ncbi:MAG: class I SAM-dependent methyltransferase [Pseudoramibacter sp.]
MSKEEQSEKKQLRADFKKKIENLSFGNLKPEEDYTNEEKQHVAALSSKLEQEYAQKKVTEEGHPNRPAGQAGKAMLSRMNESHGPLTQWGLSQLSFEGQDHVLDIGCGGGACLARLSKLVEKGTFVGIDYAKTSVEATKQFNQDLIQAGKLKVYEASVSKMPFDDETFDKIVTVESYYFWPDFNNDMKEVYRVLKEGGHFLLIAEIYNQEALSEEVRDNIKKYKMRNLNLDQFVEVFEQTGFSDIALHVKPHKRWIAVEGIKA